MHIESEVAKISKVRPGWRSARRKGHRLRVDFEALEGRHLLAVAIGEVPVPAFPGYSDFRGLASGPDGNVWYTRYVADEPQPGRIGRVAPDGTVTELTVPGSGVPEGITAGPDGNLWFLDNTVVGTDVSVSIDRVTTDGVITEFPLAADVGIATSITTGPDGNLWFTSDTGVNRFTTGGALTQFAVPTTTQLRQITVGPDGNLWFTRSFGDQVGRITPAGQLTEVAIPGGQGAFGAGITTGSDGNLWLLLSVGRFALTSRLERITLAGVVTEFPLSTQYDELVTGSDGALWISGGGPAVLRFDLDGTLTQYPVPTTISRTYRITAGPDGNPWFTELGANRIGRIVPDAVDDGSLALTASPDLAATEGQNFEGTVARFTDGHPGTVAGDFLARIEWGDGATSQGQITEDGSGGFLVRGQHFYNRQGSYPVKTIVFDPTFNAPRNAAASGAMAVANTPLAPVPLDTLAFRGQITPIHVATANAVVSTADYSATIDWGDGATSEGTVTTWPIFDQFGVVRQVTVYGSHVYAADGWYIVRTHIVDEVGLETTVTSQVQYVTPAIVAKRAVGVAATRGVPTGHVAVASFSTSGPNLDPKLFAATIDWGDGTTPAPGTVTESGQFGFTVRGSHRYARTGNYTVHVTIGGLGAPAIVAGRAHVVAPPLAVSGRLSPGSDTGASNADGITSASRPRFVGAATPGSTVRLFAWPGGTGTPSLIGQVVASARGVWSLTSRSLPDGAYAISAAVSAADGRRASTRLSLGARARLLVVDTAGPRIRSVALDPSAGKVLINFADAGGLDSRGLSDRAGYRLVRTTGSTVVPIAVRRASPLNGGRSVVLDLASRLANGRYAFRILSARVLDLAGNALDGEFRGSFATGNKRPGGDFQGRFTVRGNRATGPTAG